MLDRGVIPVDLISNFVLKVIFQIKTDSATTFVFTIEELKVVPRNSNKRRSLLFLNHVSVIIIMSNLYSDSI